MCQEHCQEKIRIGPCPQCTYCSGEDNRARAVHLALWERGGIRTGTAIRPATTLFFTDTFISWWVCRWWGHHGTFT